MYYIFYSTRGKYQVCTFSPYKYSHWREDLTDCIAEGLRTALTIESKRIITPEARITNFNQVFSGVASCTLVAQVDTLADLPDLYPELFI